MSANTTEKDVFIKMVLSNWELQINRMNGLLSKLTDEELSAETAPGRNTGTYLLGHLAAVSDGMFALLGLDERIDPKMDEIFLHNPDKSGIEKPSISEIKDYWRKVNATLADRINQIQSDQWLTKHTAVSEEDF
ncbi:MAG: DinB family protein, partial [Mucilaginibacter sp.]